MRTEDPVPLLTNAEYLGLGRRIARLLGAALEGLSAEALRELARAYDPAANEARISAEVFLFYKFLLMQACVGVFPETRSITSLQGSAPHSTSGPASWN